MTDIVRLKKALQNVVDIRVKAVGLTRYWVFIFKDGTGLAVPFYSVLKKVIK